MFPQNVPHKRVLIDLASKLWTSERQRMVVEGPPHGSLDAARGKPERDKPKVHIEHDNTMHKWLSEVHVLDHE